MEQKNISAAAKNIMLQHSWPGNVRELLNTLQRASVWSDEATIDANAMKDSILKIPQRGACHQSIMDRPVEGGVELTGLMAEVARHYIKRALLFTNNNKTQTANLLGFSNYQTLTNWIKRYDI
jgi:DNA-binding NtrC family response regulator